jgi:antirestriction protein
MGLIIFSTEKILTPNFLYAILFSSGDDSSAQIKRNVNMIKIWFANLAKYNEGELVGEWLSLPMSEDDLREKMAKILGEDEEYFLADWECEITGIVNEYCSPLKLNEIAEELESLSDSDLKRVRYLSEDYGYAIEKALCYYEDVLIYEEMSMTDLAEQMLDEGVFGQIPDSIRSYIDCEAIARDLRHDGYHSQDGDIYRFCN